MKKLLIITLLLTSLSADDYEKGWQAIRVGDFEKALALWKPLAEAGHVEAQSNIGLMYCSGDGVLQDFKECTYWIKKARSGGKNVSKIWNDYQLWKYDHETK